MLMIDDPAKRSGKRVRWRYSACVMVALALVGVTAETWARKCARPMPRKDVATTWVGISPDGHYALRLTLLLNGTGIGAYTYLDDETRSFPIPKWEYDTGKILIEAVPPPGEPSWVKTMKGTEAGYTISLHVKGDDWELDFALRREEELLDRWNRLKEAMGR